MFKPSPVLGARLRLTTKQVNKGYYKGNRTGSMGAHTRYGAYMIDWRKVRHYVVPDLSECRLTPYVTKQMAPTKLKETRPDGTTYRPKLVDGLAHLKMWAMENPNEFERTEQMYREEKGQDGQEPAPARTNHLQHPTEPAPTEMGDAKA